MMRCMMEHGPCDYETNKSPDLPSASQRIRKAGGVILSENQGHDVQGQGSMKVQGRMKAKEANPLLFFSMRGP